MEKVTPLSTERALTLCARSLRGDSNIIKDLLESKQAEAFMINQCCFITRFEQTPQGKELVVMCAEGKGLNDSGRALRQLAKQHHCTTARMHTNRKGMQRLAAEFGWVQHEVVFKMSI